ncbi:MAG: TlpA disulfide reductase family protein [Bacteroidota bacterium]|nr:TlpA disulfide reductase family protein [Bacteroidota bacterium]
MKPKTLLIILLVAVAMSAQAQQEKVVERPHAVFTNTRTIEIAKVTLSDMETVLDTKAFFRPRSWIKIASDSYLLADGKKYMIRDGEGIELDSLFWMPQSGEAEFKLVFEPLPIETAKFDFIESDCDDCFKIYGIHLTSQRVPLPGIPDEFTREQPVEANFQAQLQKGEAHVSGKIMGYVPTHEKYELYYLNPITGTVTSEPLPIHSDGSFSSSITVYSPTQILISDRKLFTTSIRVAPDQESKVWINFPEMYRSGSRLLKDEPSYGNEAYFSGYFAGLNTDLNRVVRSEIMPFDVTDSVAGMNANEYKSFLLKEFDNSTKRIEDLDIQPLAKKILKAELAFALYSNMERMEYYLLQAYMKKEGLSYQEAKKTFKLPLRPAGFSDYCQLIPYDDIDIVLVNTFANEVELLGYCRGDSYDPSEVPRYLATHENVSSEDQELLKAFISAQEKQEEFKEIATINNILGKYKELSAQYMQDKTGVGFLSKIWDTEDAFLLNLVKSMKISSGMKDFNPLTDEQKAELATMPPLIQETVLKENDDLLAKIEENKKKTGYTVFAPPSNVDEQLFLDLIKPFKGKVILVDIWATWCGPCRAAHPLMEPVKAQFADKDVVFLYLAGEDSPENTWKNMIADIPGSHYRLNKEQWDYLSKSLNVRGVPTYLILDREGNQTYYTAGFPGADTMKRELNKALNK